MTLEGKEWGVLQNLPASPTHAPLMGTSFCPTGSPAMGARGQSSGKNRGDFFGAGGKLPSVSRAGGRHEHSGSDSCRGGTEGWRAAGGTVSPHLHQRNLLGARGPVGLAGLLGSRMGLLPHPPLPSPGSLPLTKDTGCPRQDLSGVKPRAAG